MPAAQLDCQLVQLRSDFCFPGDELFVQLRCLRVECLLDFCELAIQLGDALLVFGNRNWSRLLAAHSGFGEICKEGSQAVEILHGEGVEFVVVALRATHRGT